MKYQDTTYLIYYTTLYNSIERHMLKYKVNRKLITKLIWNNIHVMCRIEKYQRKRKIKHENESYFNSFDFWTMHFFTLFFSSLMAYFMINLRTFGQIQLYIQCVIFTYLVYIICYSFLIRIPFHFLLELR